MKKLKKNGKLYEKLENHTKKLKKITQKIKKITQKIKKITQKLKKLIKFFAEIENIMFWELIL